MSDVTRTDLVENWESSGGNPYDDVDPERYLEERYLAGAKYNAGGIHSLLPGFMKDCLPSKLTSVLDLGAGPTVYLPVVMRNIADNVYTSDYAEANRDILEKFVTKQHHFDWDLVCKETAAAEGSNDSTEHMLENARKKIKAILDVDVYKPEVVNRIHWKAEGADVPKKFQLVTSLHCHFTICSSLKGFQDSIRNSVNLVEDGGYFLIGGIPNLPTFEIRGEDKFCSYPLTTDEVIDALSKAGLGTSDGFKMVQYPRHSGQHFMVALAKKL